METTDGEQPTSRAAAYRRSQGQKLDEILERTKTIEEKVAESMQRIGLNVPPGYKLEVSEPNPDGWTTVHATPSQSQGDQDYSIRWIEADHVPFQIGEPMTFTPDHDEAVRLAAIRSLHQRVRLDPPLTRRGRRKGRKAGFKAGDEVCWNCRELWPCTHIRVADSRP